MSEHFRFSADSSVHEVTTVDISFDQGHTADVLVRLDEVGFYTAHNNYVEEVC